MLTTFKIEVKKWSISNDFQIVIQIVTVLVLFKSLKWILSLIPPYANYLKGSTETKFSFSKNNGLLALANAL
jgi:hypothetical protein